MAGPISYQKLHDKMKGMAMIVRGIKRATKRPTEARLKTSIMSFIQNIYLSKAFPLADVKDEKMKFMGTNLEKIFQELMRGQGYNFTREIEGIIRIVLLEDTQNIPVVSGKKKK